MKILHKFDLLFSAFNQDCSCLAIGTKKGFKIFNCEPFGKTLVRSDGGIGIIEMLFNTSLIALVGAGEQPTHSPRRLQIMNIKKQLIISELNFSTAILSVHLNRKTLGVVFSSSIQLYDLSNMRLIYSIETNYHPNMVTAMSPSSDCNYLAYPSFSYPTDGNGSATNPNSTLTPLQSTSPTSSTTTSTASPSLSSGNITLFDIQSLQPVLILSAHKAPIAVMTFSYTGRYLATASTKGTLIRVFSVPGGTPLYEFRRGTYPVTLFHLCFHPNETYLAVSSETETLHVFKLLVPTTSSTLFHGLTSLWHRKLPSYFPSMVTHRMMDPTRDFAFGKLPSSCVGYKASVGFSTTSPHLFVVTQEGMFLKYSMDLEKGGMCTLVHEEELLDKSPGVNAGDV